MAGRVCRPRVSARAIRVRPLSCLLDLALIIRRYYDLILSPRRQAGLGRFPRLAIQSPNPRPITPVQDRWPRKCQIRRVFLQDAASSGAPNRVMRSANCNTGNHKPTLSAHVAYIQSHSKILYQQHRIRRGLLRHHRHCDFSVPATRGFPCPHDQRNPDLCRGFGLC